MNRYTELKKKLESSVSSDGAVSGEGAYNLAVADALVEFDKVLNQSNAVLSAVGHDLNILIPLVNKFVFSTFSKIRLNAIPVFRKLQTCLGENTQLKKMAWWKEYKTALEKSCEKLSVIKNSGGEEWSVIWCILVRMLGEDIHSSLGLTNALLKILEKAFKSKSPNQDKERQTGFQCWRTMVDSFAAAKEPLSKRRMEFLLIPLKAPNHSSKIVCESKLETWMHIVSKMVIKDEIYAEIFIPPLMDFLYSGNKVLPPAWNLISASRCASEFMSVLRVPNVFKHQASLLLKMSANCMETVKDDTQMSQVVWCNVLDAVRKYFEGSTPEKSDGDHIILELVTVIDRLSISFPKTEFTKLILTCTHGKSKLTQLRNKFQMLIDIVFKPKLLIKLDTEVSNVVHALFDLYMPKERSEKVFSTVLDSIQLAATNTENSEETADILNKLSEAWMATVESLLESTQWVFSDNGGYCLAYITLLLPLKYLTNKNGWCNGKVLQPWRNLFNACFKVAEANKYSIGFTNELIKKLAALSSVSYCTSLEVLNIVIDTCDSCDAVPFYAGLIDGLIKQPSDVNNANFITSFCDSMLKHVKKNNAAAPKIIEAASKLTDLKSDASNAAIKKYILKLQNSISTMDEITPKKNSKFLHRLARAKEIQSQNNSRSPSTSPISVFQLNSAEKKRASPSVKTPIKTLEEDSSQEFVMVPPKPRTTPLTEHQKECMSTRRCDIPALYQDLSQDTQTVDSLLNVDAFEKAKGNLNKTVPKENNVIIKNGHAVESIPDNSVAVGKTVQNLPDMKDAVDISLHLDYTVANITMLNNNTKHEISNVEKCGEKSGGNEKLSHTATEKSENVMDKLQSPARNGSSNSEKSLIKKRRKSDTPVRKSLRKRINKISPAKLQPKKTSRRTIAMGDNLNKTVTEEVIGKGTSLQKNSQSKTRKSIAVLNCLQNNLEDQSGIEVLKTLADDKNMKDNNNEPSESNEPSLGVVPVSSRICEEPVSEKSKIKELQRFRKRNSLKQTIETVGMKDENLVTSTSENLKVSDSVKNTNSNSSAKGKQGKTPVVSDNPAALLDDAVPTEVFEDHFKKTSSQTESINYGALVKNDLQEDLLETDDKLKQKIRKKRKTIADVTELEIKRKVMMPQSEECKEGPVMADKSESNKVSDQTKPENGEKQVAMETTDSCILVTDEKSTLKISVETPPNHRRLRLNSRSHTKRSSCPCCDDKNDLTPKRKSLSRALFEQNDASARKRKRSENLTSEIVAKVECKEPCLKRIKKSENDLEIFKPEEAEDIKNRLDFSEAVEQASANRVSLEMEETIKKEVNSLSKPNDNDDSDVLKVHISEEEKNELESSICKSETEVLISDCRMDVCQYGEDVISEKEKNKENVIQDTEEITQNSSEKLEENSTSNSEKIICPIEENSKLKEINENEQNFSSINGLHESETKQSFCEPVLSYPCIKSSAEISELDVAGKSNNSETEAPVTDHKDEAESFKAKVMAKHNLDSWVIRPSKENQAKSFNQKQSSDDIKQTNSSGNESKALSISDSDDSYIDSSQEPTDSIIAKKCSVINLSKVSDNEEDNFTEAIEEPCLDPPLYEVTVSNDNNCKINITIEKPEDSNKVADENGKKKSCDKQDVNKSTQAEVCAASDITPMKSSSLLFARLSTGEPSKSLEKVEKNDNEIDKSPKLSVCRRLVDEMKDGDFQEETEMICDSETLVVDETESEKCHLKPVMEENNAKFSVAIAQGKIEGKILSSSSEKESSEEIVDDEISGKNDSSVSSVPLKSNVTDTSSENSDKKASNADDLTTGREKRSPLKKSYIFSNKQKPESKVSSPSRASRIKELISNSLSPEKTNITYDNQPPVSSPQSARGRTAQILELVNGDSTSRLSRHQPTPRRLRPMRINYPTEMRETKEGASDWVCKTYSPHAVPSPSILKTRPNSDTSPQTSPGILKMKSSEDVPMSDVSPPTKKKRVNFHDPPLTKRLYFDKLEYGVGKVVTQGKSAEMPDSSLPCTELEVMPMCRNIPLEKVQENSPSSSTSNPEAADPELKHSVENCTSPLHSGNEVLTSPLSTDEEMCEVKKEEIIVVQSDSSVNTSLDLLTANDFAEELFSKIDQKSKVKCIADTVLLDRSILSQVFNETSLEVKLATVLDMLKETPSLLSCLMKEGVVREYISKDDDILNDSIDRISMEKRIDLLTKNVENHPKIIETVHKKIDMEHVAENIAIEISKNPNLANSILNKTDIKTVASLMKSGSEIILKSLSSE